MLKIYCIYLNSVYIGAGQKTAARKKTGAARKRAKAVLTDWPI
jgi:hypothetical protein